MEKVVEIILALIVIASTLAFGGVQPLAYSLMELGVLFALLLLLAKQTRQGAIGIPLPLAPVLFILLILLQVIPLPPGLVVRLSPARLLDPAIASRVASGQGWATLSIYPHDTLMMLVRFAAYLSAFLLAAHLFDSGKRKSLLVRTLIFLGGFEAVYGIFQYLTGWQKIFWVAKEYDLEEGTGTYINRNHFAGLLELTVPFVMAAAFYVFQVWSERRASGSRRRAASGETNSGYRLLLYFFLLALMLVAVLFSRSRAGILIILFTIAFVAVLAQIQTRRKYWILGVLLFFACVAGLGMWIGLNPVLSRFDQGSGPLRMEGRVPLWKDELNSVRDYPLLGTGLGTFAVGFRHYQTTLVESFVDQAHNDYLQFASDTGLLGAALLFLPILLLFLRMILSFLDDPRRYRRAVTLGCIGSTLGILVHSLVDFNLQIPSNALIFAVVLGVGYKAVSIERREEGPVGVPAAGVATPAAGPAAA